MQIFQLCPPIGEAIHLARLPAAPWSNEIFLLFTRASHKHLMLQDVLPLCLIDMLRQLDQNCITQVHFSIYDSERSINIPLTQYAMLRDHFTASNVEIVLHDRVNVSIASVTVTNGR